MCTRHKIINHSQIFLYIKCTVSAHKRLFVAAWAASALSVPFKHCSSLYDKSYKHLGDESKNCSPVGYFQSIHKWGTEAPAPPNPCMWRHHFATSNIVINFCPVYGSKPQVSSIFQTSIFFTDLIKPQISDSKMYD